LGEKVHTAFGTLPDVRLMG